MCVSFQDIRNFLKEKQGLDLKYLILAGIASSVLLTSCGDDIKKSKDHSNNTNNASTNNASTNNTGALCVLDVDCEVGFVCEQELCIQTCTTRAECPSGSDCLQRASGTELICVEVPGLNNDNNTNNNTAPNNLNNNASPLYHVLITDTTTGDGCSSTSGGEGDPGSDIAVVVLEDFEGNILGYGEALEWIEGSEPEGNGFLNIYANLDGTPPSFGDMCPEDYNPDTVASLGCGGQVLMRFLNGGTPVILDDSTQVRVMEYGLNCGGSADDSFRILLCTDAFSAGDGSTSSCTVNLGEGSGLVYGEVQIP